MDDKAARQCWETPCKLFDYLDREFDFDIDVAASRENSKCAIHINEQSNSLARSWIDESFLSAWCNPPYARPIDWVKKAHAETEQTPNSVCVMLLNFDPSTAWYTFAAEHAAEIRIMTGKRVQFDPPDGSGIKSSSNSKPSCLIVFRRKDKSAPCNVWHWDWHKDIYTNERGILCAKK
jgi:site-specific DNA-methyltransferase (adenine-specific)